ncbi:uncharacterized protein N7515_009495 [Penicillium bovifimosum]|uniref:Cysteine-rich transmembrane CYSTM domain-containing protein n=1 Tax=Penicillium bovifimosum TaxID=126998 RepID=A0A9W9GJM5_9EURO|nr:uncharacterized protein N7515_009495 [Penicillium bovifimosum]KAJ5121534.1 hypothetical protein N7515_009495 [Penicillium bovifimosum]
MFNALFSRFTRKDSPKSTWDTSTTTSPPSTVQNQQPRSPSAPSTTHVETKQSDDRMQLRGGGAGDICCGLCAGLLCFECCEECC